jgi:hypothetical protein
MANPEQDDKGIHEQSETETGIHASPNPYSPRWTSENRQFIDSAKPANFAGGRDQ